MRETERTRIFFDGCTAGLIMPVMSQHGADKLLLSKFMLDEASVGDGPASAQTDAQRRAASLFWSPSQRLFAGLAPGGANLVLTILEHAA
jgi:hypothetical protein